MAIDEFTPPLTEGKTLCETVTIVRHESQLTETTAVSVGTSFNIVALDNGRASAMSKIDLSATSSTVVASYRSWHGQADLAPTYTLNEDAQEFLKHTSAAQFRVRYGDYFIASARRGSTFVAVVLCKSQDVRALREFEGRFTASKDGLFNAEAAAKLDSAAISAQIDISVTIKRQGYNTGAASAPSTISVGTLAQVVQELSWFKDNERGVPTHAQLVHYSILDAARDVPRVLHINQRVFEELRELYSLLVLARILAECCPPSEDRNDFQKDSADLRAKALSWQASLPTSDASRTHLLASVRQLHERMRDVHRRFRFWVDVQSEIDKQPTNRRFTAAKNVQQWSWGYSSYPADTAIQVLSTPFVLDLPATVSPFKRDSTITCSAPEGHFIVGWEVEVCREDGHNGSWRKLSVDSLLVQEGSLTCRTKRFQGAQWRVTIYHVGHPIFAFFRRSSLPKMGQATEDLKAREARERLPALPSL